MERYKYRKKYSMGKPYNDPDNKELKEMDW